MIISPSSPRSPRPAAVSADASSSNMTRHIAARRPLGELPIENFVFAARNEDNIAAGREIQAKSSPSRGPAPILKPISAQKRTSELSGSVPHSKRLRSPEAAKTLASRLHGQQEEAVSSRPSTPPLHHTEPRNIRPHHPHVYTSSPAATVKGGQASFQALASPSIETTAAHAGKHAIDRRPSTPIQANRHARTWSQSSAATTPSEAAPSAGPSSLPRKRERVNLIEVAQARQSVDQPVAASPSPHKKAAERRISLAGRSSASKGKEVLKSEAETLESDLNADSIMLPAEAETEIDADSFEIQPLRIGGSPASSKAAVRDYDVFGSGVQTADGGLVVFEDSSADSPSSARRSSSHRGKTSNTTHLSSHNKENMSMNALQSNKPPVKQPHTSISRRRLSLGRQDDDGSDSASTSSFFKSTSPSSDSSTTSLDNPVHSRNQDASSQPISVQKRKGTGGRLSLLASADANASLESDRSREI